MKNSKDINSFFLTFIVMIAFATNSIFCREALLTQEINATEFTLIRLLSGAIILWFIVYLKNKTVKVEGNWLSAISLFGYATCFSFAYRHLSAGTGALLLFGAVQFTMISWGLIKGERVSLIKWLGILMAFGGMVWFILPGVESPPILGAILMLISGLCWGIYSICGRSVNNPTVATCGNFIRTIPLILIIYLLTKIDTTQYTTKGLTLAILSGAIASGLGYALWYSVLPNLPALTSATVQLSVPIIAATGGALFLNEEYTQRLIVASIIVLSGIYIFINHGKSYKSSS